MDRINKFLNSIYFGDGYCEKIEIQENKIMLQINCISRIKNGTNEWNYYNDENIQHGCLVFDNVVFFDMDEDIQLNDEIYEVKVINKDKDIYSFIVYGSNISGDSVTTDIQIYIKAKSMYLLDTINNIIIEE